MLLSEGYSSISQIEEDKELKYLLSKVSKFYIHEHASIS